MVVVAMDCSIIDNTRRKLNYAQRVVYSERIKGLNGKWICWRMVVCM